MRAAGGDAGVEGVEGEAVSNGIVSTGFGAVRIGGSPAMGFPPRLDSPSSYCGHG